MIKLLNFQFGVRLALSTLTACGLTAVMLSQASTAQSQEAVDPLQDFNRREVDGLSSDGLNQNTILDLIHQAQQGSFNIDYDAVQTRQRQSIQDAAAGFREKQRQLLQQQQQNLETTGSDGSTVSPR